MTKSFFSIIIILSFFNMSFSQQSKLWKGLDQGKYDIGFKTIEITDVSRQITLDSSVVSRPIQIALWYPSEKGTEKMTMNSYFVNYALYRNFNLEPTEELMNWSRKETFEYIYSKKTNDSLAFKALFEMDTEAFYNSKAVTKKSPLIFLLSNVSTDHFLLAEYLASHGYVVVCKYADGLITNIWKGWDSLANSVNNDLIDLNIITTYLSKINTIDTNNVGLIGYHGNTEALILFQIANKNVKAFVSLDGGEVWSFNAAHKKAIKNHPAWQPKKVAIPYLRIQSDLDLKNSMDIKHADWWFYRETKNPITFLNIDNLNHYEFMSFLNLNHIMPGITGSVHKKPNDAHSLICNYTLHFLNYTIKNKTESQKWLSKKNLEAKYWKVYDRTSIELFTVKE